MTSKFNSAFCEQHYVLIMRIITNNFLVEPFLNAIQEQENKNDDQNKDNKDKDNKDNKDNMDTSEQ